MLTAIRVVKKKKSFEGIYELFDLLQSGGIGYIRTISHLKRRTSWEIDF